MNLYLFYIKYINKKINRYNVFGDLILSEQVPTYVICAKDDNNVEYSLNFWDEDEVLEAAYEGICYKNYSVDFDKIEEDGEIACCSTYFKKEEAAMAVINLIKSNPNRFIQSDSDIIKIACKFDIYTDIDDIDELSDICPN